MLVVGFDPGNSESTLVWKHGDKTHDMTIPSYTGTGSHQRLVTMRTAAGDGKLKKTDLVLEYDDIPYYVGQLALEESEDATSARNDVNRYWSGHTLKLLLSLVTAVDLPDTTIRVMTGLPVSAWTVAAKQKVQQSLCGKHTFRVNGIDRTLTIDAVGVMMEGAAALAAHANSGASRGVIDVGGRTTDLFWGEGVRPITRLCQGANLGVEKVADILYQKTLEFYGRELKSRELRDVLHNHADARPYPTLTHLGTKIELNGAVTSAVASVGEDIARFASQVWGDNRGQIATDAELVLLIGGGAHYFGPLLKTRIPHLKVPRNPECANVFGYLAVGQAASEAAWAKNRGQ